MTRGAWTFGFGAAFVTAAVLGCFDDAWGQTPILGIADSERPSVVAVRIDTSEAPTIDGDLSDPVWAKAAVLDDFRQMDPNTGQPATERTVLRILYDENNIYFAVYRYDREPDKIIVRSMTRDGPVFAEDQFRIALDPNMTRRDGYSFKVGPAGGREDALIQNNSLDLTRWNTIWVVRSRVVADGWMGGRDRDSVS